VVVVVVDASSTKRGSVVSDGGPSVHTPSCERLAGEKLAPTARCRARRELLGAAAVALRAGAMAPPMICLTVSRLNGGACRGMTFQHVCCSSRQDSVWDAPPDRRAMLIALKDSSTVMGLR